MCNAKLGIGLLAVGLGGYAVCSHQTSRELAVWLLYDQFVMKVIPGMFYGGIGGMIGGFIVGSGAMLEENFRFKLKVFKAGVMVQKERLKTLGFFANDNPQKYCCEGVFGSAAEQLKEVNEGFLTILLLLGVILAYIVISTVWSFTESWLYTLFLIPQGIVLNYSFVRLLDVSWARDLIKKDPELGNIQQKIEIIQAGGILNPEELRGRKNRRNRANQPNQNQANLAELDPPAHARLRMTQLEVLLNQRNNRIAGFPQGMTDQGAGVLASHYRSAYAFNLIPIMLGLIILSTVLQKAISFQFGIMPGSASANANSTANITSTDNSTLNLTQQLLNISNNTTSF